MSRGFEPVLTPFRKYEVEEVQLPTRADKRSAGYDFYAPVDVALMPNSVVVIWTNVKAYMEDDEVLELYVRSSIGINNQVMLANTVGIIDSSYYSNVKNDGNIGVALYNYGNEPVQIKAGDRIAQGIFQKYLTAENDVVLNKERTGGIGSSGK